jgi:hypothetical protein
VLPSVVLCFVTVGPSASKSHLDSPSQVVWMPERQPTRTDQYCLPETVCEVYDRSGGPIRKIREHHIFVRPQAKELFFYAGDAHLGSYGRSQAVFSLAHKLPRDMWLTLGGYPGWLVDVNHTSRRVRAGDLPAFEQLIVEKPGQEFSHFSMTRYEEDSLTVHTNATRGWLMYLRTPCDSGVYSRDANYSGPADAEEVFRCGCGIDLEFKATQTLPREQARRAAIEFFQTGVLPACVPWDGEM